MNTWDISGMFFVLWSITANIKTCEFARKPQNYLFCLIVFFPYNTCSIHINSGVCLAVGLWFVKKIKKIEARLHLFNLLGKFIFAKRGIHIWHFEFFCIKIFISCVSAHFTEPLLSENVLEISLPITSWISKLFYGTARTTSKVTAEDGSVPLAVSGIPGIKSFFLTF